MVWATIGKIGLLSISTSGHTDCESLCSSTFKQKEKTKKCVLMNGTKMQDNFFEGTLSIWSAPPFEASFTEIGSSATAAFTAFTSNFYLHIKFQIWINEKNLKRSSCFSLSHFQMSQIWDCLKEAQKTRSRCLKQVVE